MIRDINKKFTSNVVDQFPESVIRNMTRVAAQHGAINLSQGFPDHPTPKPMIQAAHRAIDEGKNQYPPPMGIESLRKALADKYERDYGMIVDPDREVTVTCGATEAMLATLTAIVNPGDEIVVFEPYYENFKAQGLLSGAKTRWIKLNQSRDGNWSFNRKELAGAFNEKTKAIILNNPNNPTGKVFTERELSFIASLCKKWNALAITDEIYDHFVYDGKQHISMATLPGMRDRTVTISGISKVYAATGWRVGWIIAPPFITTSIRKVHDFLTMAAPHPFQEAAAVALRLPPSYYRNMLGSYAKRRTFTVRMLQDAGFRCSEPEGAYYIMADFSNVNAPPDAKENDTNFVDWLIREIGVAGVPGSCFYNNPQDGSSSLRISFGRSMSALKQAKNRLIKINRN